MFSFKNHALLQRDAHSCSILCAFTARETTAIEPPTDLLTEVKTNKKTEKTQNKPKRMNDLVYKETVCVASIRKSTISGWFQKLYFHKKIFTLIYQTEQKTNFLNSVYRGLIGKLSSLLLMLNEKIKIRKKVVF